MNEKMAQAIGIKWLKKGKSTGSPAKSDVNVTAGKDKRQYRISFSKSKGSFFGDYLKVCHLNNRIYFMPSQTCDEESYKFDLNAGKSTRKAVQISRSIIGDIDDFLGEHELKYFPEADLHYISKNKEATA